MKEIPAELRLKHRIPTIKTMYLVKIFKMFARVRLNIWRGVLHL